MSRLFTGLPSAVIYGYGGAVKRASDHAVPPPPPTPPITSFPVGDASQRPMVHVFDTTTSRTLYEMNADVQSDMPGSVVKLMTAYLAINLAVIELTNTIEFVASDVAQPIGGITVTMAGFQAGDIATLEDVLYGLFLPSGADACQAIARIYGAAILGGEPTEDDSRAAFVAYMNTKAAELTVEGVFTDAFGGSRTGATIRNTLSARDMTKLLMAAFGSADLRTIAGTPQRIINAGGRSITVDNYSPYINGPYFNRSLIKQTDVIGGKNGVWEIDSRWNHNCVLMWSPNGGNNEIIISTLQSKHPFASILDQRGMMAMIIRDWSYLTDYSTDTDPSWSSVKILVDVVGGVITDHSTVARTTTLVSVTSGTPVNASPGSAVFNSTTDSVSFADATDLTVASQDMTVEEWYAGSGASAPGSEYVFFAKWLPGQVEWLLDYNGGIFQLFASSNGSGVTVGAAINTDPFYRDVFFNGAPRHIAITKVGAVWACYLCGERMVGTITQDAIFDGIAPVTIGLAAATATPLGKVSDFRLTMGVARYTANMETIDSRPFPKV